MMTRPTKLTLSVQDSLVGFATRSVRGGDAAEICHRGFFTSDDGPLLYTYLDSLFSGILGGPLERAGVRAEEIDTCLVNIVDRTQLTAWVNFPVVLDVLAKTAMKAGHAVTLDDIADVRGVTLDGVEMPTKGAIAYTFKHGFRRGFYFDFSPHCPPIDPNRALPDLSSLLGSFHAALLLRERIRMQPKVLESMFAAGWFPFARIPHDLVMALYRHFEEGWDHHTTEEEIIRALSPTVPSWVDAWRRKPAFAPHVAALQTAAKHFEKAEYLAASAIVLPKIEGVLRTLSLGRGRSSARDLRRNLLARVRADVCGATALLPEAFVEYLEDYYYAGFDLDANEIPPSRHAFMHGVGPDDEADKAGFALRLLLTLDQLFFYV